MSDDDEITRRYYEDFGKRDYDAAIHALWEDHNAYGRHGRCPEWPPSLEQVKEAVKREQDRRAWGDRR